MSQMEPARSQSTDIAYRDEWKRELEEAVNATSTALTTMGKGLEVLAGAVKKIDQGGVFTVEELRSVAVVLATAQELENTIGRSPISYRGWTDFRFMPALVAQAIADPSCGDRAGRIKNAAEQVAKAQAHVSDVPKSWGFGE